MKLSVGLMEGRSSSTSNCSERSGRRRPELSPGRYRFDIGDRRSTPVDAAASFALDDVDDRNRFSLGAQGAAGLSRRPAHCEAARAYGHQRCGAGRIRHQRHLVGNERDLSARIAEGPRGDFAKLAVLSEAQSGKCRPRQCSLRIAGRDHPMVRKGSASRFRCLRRRSLPAYRASQKRIRLP